MSRLSQEIRELLAADDAGRTRQPLHGHVRRMLAEAVIELEAPAIDAAAAAAQMVVARAVAWKRAYDCAGHVDEQIAAHQLIETIEALPAHGAKINCSACGVSHVATAELGTAWRPRSATASSMTSPSNGAKPRKDRRTMSKPRDDMVEAVARAIVTAAGHDPDKVINYDDGSWLQSLPLWQCSARNQAITQIAAFDAINEFRRVHMHRDDPAKPD